MIPLLPFTIPLLMFKIFREKKNTNNVTKVNTALCCVIFMRIS